MKITVHGNPSEQEVAAIVAAIEMSWPTPAPASASSGPTSTTWRHSGRWWSDGRLPKTWS